MRPSDAEAISRWRDGCTRRAIVVNNTFKLLPVADIVYACDVRWWNQYAAEVKAICSGALWAHDVEACDRFGLQQARMETTGGNSGYQAARLAVENFAAARVILVGFDMQGDHWHGRHPKGWPNPDAKLCKKWIGWMGRLVSEFPAVDWINATRETAIPNQVIRRLPLEEALCSS